MPCKGGTGDRLRRTAGLVTGGLLFWTPLAATLGIVAHGAASRGMPLIPLLLAILVFATGFTVPPARLAAVLQRPARLLAVLVLQYGPLSLLAYLLSRLPVSAAVSTGILVLGAAPSEITSGVMVLLAGGDTALGTAQMAASLLASTVLTPALLTLYAGGSLYVDRAGLVQELTLSVALPLFAAVALRGAATRRGARAGMDASLALWDEAVAPAAFPGPGLDSFVAALDVLLPAVAALAVIVLIFIIAGTARGVLLSGDLFASVGECLVLNIAGYAAGRTLFRIMRAPEPAVRAAVFTTGMREFGVAATVAATVLPAATGVTGVYGILILFTAPLLVRRYRAVDQNAGTAHPAEEP